MEQLVACEAHYLEVVGSSPTPAPIKTKGGTALKCIKIDLPSGLSEVEIYPLGDLHVGESGCDMSLIKATIAEIKSKPNAYVILNGDLMNNATTSSISDTYSETMSPMEAMQAVVDLFSPIKDRIIGITTGNHERRSYRSDGVDLTKVIAKELGVADRYDPDGVMMFLRFGTQSRYKSRGRKVLYTIYATHGTGGGRKVGGKVNRVEDLSVIVDADIYIHSHTHTPFAFKEEFLRVNECGSSVYNVVKTFVNTAASLVYGGYGQAAGYRPSCTETPHIVCDGTKKKVRVIV